MLNPSNTVFLVKRWQHHTPSGGYDRLAAVMNGKVVTRRGRGGFMDRSARRLWRTLARPPRGLLDYTDEDWIAEWTLLAKARRELPDVVHAIYGDEQLNSLLRWRRLLPCPLVATFHLPTQRSYVRERFERYQKHLIGGIDAAIVVSRCQLADFQRWLRPERVIYIPHGIDTTVFRPASKTSREGRIRLLSVGEHMRDMETLHIVIDECRRLTLPVEFDLVIPKSSYSCFYGCSNVRFHTGISEDQLIHLYREADALVLPILEATANNAVLESMACGTPVISTAVGGIPDYLDTAAGWLLPVGDVRGILELISSACRDRAVLQSLRAGAREKSLEFSWDKVGSQVAAVYRAVSKRSAIELGDLNLSSQTSACAISSDE